MFYLTAIRIENGGRYRLHGFDSANSFYFEFTDNDVLQYYGTDPDFDLLTSYINELSGIPGSSQFWLHSYTVIETLDVCRVYGRSARINVVGP